MKKLIKILTNIIEDSKLDMCKAFTEFYGEEYEEYIYKRIDKVKVMIYHEDIRHNDLKNLYLAVNRNNFINAEEINDRINQLIKYYNIIDNIDNIALNNCKKFFPDMKRRVFIKSFVDEVKSFKYKIPSKDPLKDKKIMNLRVSFFKDMGINLGDDYNSYLTPEVMKIVPKKRELKKFEKVMDSVYSGYYKLIAKFASNKEELEKELDNERYYRVKINEPKINMAYCMGNSRNGYLNPVCIFHLWNIYLGQDRMFIHELSHALTYYNYQKAGIDCNNNYKLLNEALNEAIVAQVYRNMINRGRGVFSNNYTEDNTSIYTPIIPIGDAFSKKFKADLFKMQLCDEEELYKYIDKDTLKALDDLCYSIIYDENNEKINDILVQEAINIINNYKIHKNNRLN